MTDINKYLESQQALAQKKSIENKRGLLLNISEKNIKSAEVISKKQNNELKNCENSNKIREEICVSYAGTSNTVSEANETGSEYVPSSDEEVGHTSATTTTCRSNKKLNSKKETAKTFSDDRVSDSEYVPSSDEEEVRHVSIATTTCRSSKKNNLKRVSDDGDKKMYQQRTDLWNLSLKTFRNEGAVDESEVLTADVRYLVKGNNDGDEEHEVSGGLRVPNYIWKQLYKYQRTGVKWLWELHQLKSGGLLGDEMGLGKTVQLIAFFAGLSKTSEGKWGGLGPSIIVTPATVIYQWVSHFHYWFPSLRVAVLHSSGSHNGRHHSLIREIHDSHGILLVTYAGVVKYNSDLLNRNWHYIVLDEGHKIRNPETQVSKMVKKFGTPHRILITGSPMQNSLQELWSLFDFMSPGLLGTQTAFMEFFALPITQGGYSNATQLQEVTAYEIAKSLKNIITPYMIRRTKAEVQEHIQLPDKNEQVLFCSLSKEQRDLYLGYLLSGTVRSILDKDHRYGEPMRARILVAISTLRKICNHPDLYLCEACDENDSVVEENFGHWKRSGKMIVVQSLLKIWHKQGHRALIFSQSRTMLCILEQFLLQNNYKYLKMDGAVSVGLRQNIIKTFNDNAEYLVFLATTRVGGLGVNLTGADRVIIYDPDWNPATDSQAKERAWRIGQRKNVTIYRLLSAGTIEEKIYQRQVFKHILGNKVLIDPNQKNPLKTSHLQGLFTLEEPNQEGDTETASIFSHTKVGTSQKEENVSKNIRLSGSVSFSMKKMAAMRKKAREISRKISKEYAPDPIDNRKRYKKQRDMLLNPPKEEEPEVNLVDDEITDVPFDKALSELDIVNLHAKKDYLDKLLNPSVQSAEEEKVQSDLGDEVQQRMSQKNENNKISNSFVIEDSTKSRIIAKTVVVAECSSSEVTQTVSDNKKEKKNKRRKHEELTEKVEGLVAVKKVKRAHKTKVKRTENSDDDYVLNKLFAKSGVQSALEHDKVVGLSEREDRLRLKEEASKKAKAALKALKKSLRRPNFE